MPEEEEPETVRLAREILAASALYDAFTLQLAAGVIRWWEAERDAGAPPRSPPRSPS